MSQMQNVDGPAGSDPPASQRPTATNHDAYMPHILARLLSIWLVTGGVYGIVGAFDSLSLLAFGAFGWTVWIGVNLWKGNRLGYVWEEDSSLHRYLRRPLHGFSIGTSLDWIVLYDSSGRITRYTLGSCQV